MRISCLLANIFLLIAPSIFFAVSYRYPIVVVVIGCAFLAFGLLLVHCFPLERANTSFRYLLVASVFLYGLFKAVSFDNFYLQAHTFFYYSIFTSLFFLLAMRAFATQWRVQMLWGFVVAALGIQILYLSGMMDWNQYQIVGNVTFLALLAAHVLQRKFLMLVLALFVLNTPSTQSQVLLMLFCVYLVYSNADRASGSSHIRYFRMVGIFLIIAPVFIFLTTRFGDALMFSEQSNARQFEFALRIYDRTLIFLDHVSLINPILPVDQMEIEASSRSGLLTSAETRVHGIWLAYLIYMGAFLGGVGLLTFGWGMWHLANGNLILIFLCLTPWLISSEVNPIKYALCAAAIIQALLALRDRVVH
jgi:hypothetical protein